MLRISPLLLALLAFGGAAYSQEAPRLLQDAELASLARKCGSEIGWISDPYEPKDAADVFPKAGQADPADVNHLALLDQAKKKATETKRLILCAIYKIRGKHMYRAPLLDDYMNAVVWSDADVVDLVKRKFVPLRLYCDSQVAKVLDIKVPAFVEPIIMILDADGKALRTIDRIRTFSADWVRAALASTVGDEAVAGDTPYEKAIALRRARKGTEALEALKDEKSGEAAAERGLVLLRLGKIEEAREQLKAALESTRAAEAQYNMALIEYMTADEAGAKQRWQGLVRDHPDSRWAWKAAMNLESWEDTTPRGPVPHAFEDVFWAPEAAYGALPSTCWPRTAEDADDVARRAVEFLLRSQGANGAWNDARYAYWGGPGKPILPNVRMAVTSLACAALLEWRQLDPERIDKALARGEAYILDDAHMSPGANEECYANAYRLLYLARRHAAEKDDAKRAASVKAMTKVAKRLEMTITPEGFWSHEYPNPFATAAAIICLDEAKREGAPVPAGLLKKASDSLATQRGKNGGFTYAAGRRPSGLKDSAARMPVCELGLFAAGKSTQADVQAALDGWWASYPRIEKVRVCDFHADGELGGFFFFHGFFHATQSALVLEEKPREEQQAKFLEALVRLPEIDGSFIDDHELGKCYGTAMALLSLRNCLSEGMSQK